MGTKASRLIGLVRSVAFGPPATTGLTPTQARVLYSARAQAMEWGKLWRFTGIYPEHHRDGAEPSRRRGALDR